MNYLHLCFCILLSISTLLTTASGACNCDKATRHYEELGCTPVYAKPKDCCPSHYDCKEPLSRMSKPDTCIFKGKEYKTREQIPGSLTEGNCLAACFCGEKGRIICAHIDCPEFLGAFPLQPGCIRVYKRNECCSSGTACPPFDRLAQCKIGSKIYYEGQHFYPEDGQCLSCLCQKGFKGKFEEPFCQPTSCATELKSEEIQKNCAPVYYGNEGCCPIQWECHDESSKHTIGKKLEGTPDAKSCVYGNRELNIGETFEIERKYKYSPEIKCECEVPPLVTCHQTPHSN